VIVISVRVPAAGIAGFGVVGLGVSAIVPLTWSRAGKMQPESPGQAISAVATFGYLGFLLGPVLVGGLAGLVGLRLALVGTAVVTFTICFLAHALRSRVTAVAGGVSQGS
jgi:MFS family permease